MTAENNIRSQFEVLLNQGSLPRSACSRSLLEALRPLLDSYVVVEERSGAGRRLVVRDAPVAQDFFAQRYPDAAVFEGASNRIVGAARFRDTKALSFNEPIPVCVRAWDGNVLFHGDQSVDAAAATTTHGVFAFLLYAQNPYTLRGACALVENPAVFSCIERLNVPVHLAIYGQGRISTRLLDWLVSISAPCFTLLHLPDYDPVGLSEFGRLRARLGKRVRLHLPSDLSARFERFSNRSLLDKPNSRAVLVNLRRSPVPEISQVLELIERYNAGLEQEALLPDLSAGPNVW